MQRPGIRHGFIGRVPGVELSNDKSVVLANLDGVHRRARALLDVDAYPFATAQQVHGNAVAVIDAPLHADRCFAACDGLVTNQPELCLGIYVADCCAVYLVDRERRAIGLVHSGKKGTALGIATEAIDAMRQHFGVESRDLTVQLSPCIRPPHYEIDFAAQIAAQCQRAGVTELHDSGVCTACHLERYYSYRAEKGRTGRMLAFLAMSP